MASGSRSFGIVSLVVLASAWGFGLGVSGCKRSSPSGSTAAGATGEQAEKNKAFWTWFQAHSAEIARITTAKELIADELHIELSKVRSELTFELGPKETPRELIVSADGIVGAFPAVQSLVSAAPPLPGWKVIAFRPRKPGLSIEMGDVKLTPTDVKFTSSNESTGKTAVTIFVPGRTRENAKQVDGAVLLLLDAVVGEYDTEVRLGEISIKPIDEAGKRELQPLADLAGVVDAKKPK